MPEFKFDSPAEVYCQKVAKIGGRGGLAYRRFNTGAEAIRFAVEHLPAEHFSSCTVEVDGEHYGAEELRSLYESALYTLPRAVRK
jgi:hypothetical protein